MSDAAKSALAIALAKLEAAMGATTTGGASPERRRAAHRLGELLRTNATELPRFAARHLPGREVEVGDLERARELVLALDRLLALLGRGVDAAGLLREIEASLVGRLDELEAGAAAPRVPSVTHLVAVEAAPPPPVGGPTAAALPGPVLLEARAPSVLGGASHPAQVSAPRVSPSPWEGAPKENPAPPWLDREDAPPRSETLDEVAREREAAPVAPTPFAASGPRASRAMPVVPGSERPHVLPFARSAGGSASSAPSVQDHALPFRTGRFLAVPSLPAQLRELDLAAYATFRALVELFPARRAELHAHYRIPDESTAAALEAHWQHRLAANPEERAAWDAEYRRALEHYRSGG